MAEYGGSFSIRSRVVRELEIIEDGLVLVEKGRIRHVGPFDRSRVAGPLLEAGQGWLVPGFIDIHVHGGNGRDFMEGTHEAFDSIAGFHSRHGTTAMLATTVTAPKGALDDVLQAASVYKNRTAQIIGVHLEGPFINPKRSGAQNPNHITVPRLDWVEEWLQRYSAVLKMVTLAPEMPGASDVIRRLAQTGIICACGHTDATYDQIRDAADLGLRHAVHAFNAMRGLHHREPGTAGAVMEDDRISAELIADGIHVARPVARILGRVKPENGLILVTDAISAAGLGDGEYELYGLRVIVKGGEARLERDGALAGSLLTMDAAFRFMVREAGFGIVEASRMTAGNPARLLGIADQKGSITAGKDADLVLLDERLEIARVWIKGHPVAS